MKLLVVSSWLPCPPDNGSRLRAFHLLEQLSSRHEITLLSLRRADDASATAPLDRFCRRVSLVTVPDANPQRLTTRGLLSPVPRYHVQTESREMKALIGATSRDHDAIVALAALAAYHVAGVTHGLPAVFDELEIGAARDAFDSEPWTLWHLRRGLTWWKFRRFVQGLSARFDQTTVVSEVERRLAESIGCDPARLAVVPNGVTLSGSRDRGQVREQLIYPGAVTYSANLDAVGYFVRAVFPRIRASRPAMQFVVTGSTDGCDVRDLAAWDGVRFTGRVPDVTPLVRESLACVVPLRRGGGTRLKVLQAMALGVPVVTTSKGIEGLEVEAERHVLVADAAQGFADQVVRLATDPALGERLAVDARRLVEERYGWPRIGDAFEAVLQAAMSRRPWAH